MIKNISYRIRQRIRSFMVAASALMLISCVSIFSVPDDTPQEQIKAENRIMKQNLNLAVRENSILKEENIQSRGENNNLKSRVKLLESEIESLNKKHSEDIALLNEKYENLNRKNQILENESSARIKDLTAVNKSLENRMISEIARLTEEMRKRDEDFNRERSKIETAFSARELEYQKQAASLQKDILTANTELESYKSRLAESKAALDAANAELVKKEETISGLNSKLNSTVIPASSDGTDKK